MQCELKFLCTIKALRFLLQHELIALTCRGRHPPGGMNSVGLDLLNWKEFMGQHWQIEIDVWCLSCNIRV